jgi:hypothetical protein
MTEQQWALIDALAGVSFAPATASKRFVRDRYAAGKDSVLSDRGEAFAWRIAYHYRRQLPQSIADEATRRRVDHDWRPSVGQGADLKCSVCGYLGWTSNKRALNTPCPGPPPPKPEPKPKRAKVSAALPPEPAQEQMRLV